MQPVPSEVINDPEVNSNYNGVHAAAEDEGNPSSVAGAADIADSVHAARNGKPLHSKKVVKMTMV